MDSTIKGKLGPQKHTPSPEATKEKMKTLITAYWKSQQKFPTIAWMASKLSITKTRTAEILKQLEEEGFVKRKHAYRTLDEPPQQDPVSASVEKVRNTWIINPGIIFLKVVMFIVGSGAVYMSIYHSRDFLSDFYSPFKASVSAFIMVLFAVSSFDTAIYFFREKGPKIALGVIFVFLGGVVSLFSMTSTVGGLYNARAYKLREAMNTQQETKTSDQQTLRLYENILARKSEAARRVESEREKRDGFVTLINSYTEDMIAEDPDNYNKHNYRRYLADENLKKYETAYDSIVEEEDLFLSQNTIPESNPADNIPDFYQWIGGAVFTSLRSDMIQFWISCLPAIFYDIIAPLAFAVVIFVHGGKK